MPHLSRRTLLLSAAALAVTSRVMATTPSVHVMKDPTCPCCNAWIGVLEADGFAVTFETVENAALADRKAQLGVPADAVSCHTGQVEGYVLEGHVPPADIRRLLAERPDAIGLAVPGMPYGSPGMGPESEREAYDVLLIARDGTTSVFTQYPAA